MLFAGARILDGFSYETDSVSMAAAEVYEAMETERIRSRTEKIKRYSGKTS